MKKTVLGIIMIIVCTVSAAALEYAADTVFLNTALGIGTFSAGEYDGGSVCPEVSLSADWIPYGKTGLAYGIESGLLGGKKQNGIILGIPIMIRFGWHPVFPQLAGFDIFVLGKLGWAFGIWDSLLDNNSTPDGIACGINVGGSYPLTPEIHAYAELGYNYYGLARNTDYPEYPLGYGSGKVYVSAGVSLVLTAAP